MKTRSGGIRARITDYSLADSDTDNESGVPNEDDYSSSDGYNSPPPKKRHKSGSGASKRSKNSRSNTTGQADLKLYRGRNVGKLANMFQMPLDIFCEIAAHLEPLDLLCLGRSSRSLNNLLMSRSSKSIWRAARSTLDGLPDCPPDLSEPAYARLLFDKYCHVCLTARVMRADYVLRSRLCERCTQSNIVTGRLLLESIPGLTVELLECVPYRNRDHGRGARFKHFHKEQVKALFTEFRSVIPEDLPEAERCVLQKEFYDRRKQLVKEAVECGASLECWMTSYVARIKVQGVDTARRREASLKAKLKDLGYEISDFPDERDTEWTQIMNQPRDLTPRIWTTVRPKLEACIERVKIAREQVNRQRRERQRRLELSPFINSLIKKRKERDNQLAMTVDEALRLPTIAALVEEDDYNQVVTEGKWDAVLSQVEKDMDEFADHARNYLTGLIRASLPSSLGSAPLVDYAPASAMASTDGAKDGYHEIVSLDSAYFKCSECRFNDPLLKYPALLSHDHSMNSMTFDATLTKYAKLLLPFLGGMDEDKLFALGRQFQCLLCDEDCTRPMNWCSLIIHFKLEQEWYDEQLLFQSKDPSLVKVKLHNDHDIHNWSLDTPACRILDYDVAKSLEHRVDAMFWNAWDQGHYWNCTLCAWGMNVETWRKKVESHIRRQHLKEPEPKDMLDFCWESESF